jgi:hypothetical protein
MCWTETIGDQYLGRCLSGLNPLESEFAVLPPRFIVGMDNEDVKAAMLMCYGSLMHDSDEVNEAGVPPRSAVGILLMLLASVVYQSDWLLQTAADNPGHSFGSIPVLTCGDLLMRLKQLVTTDQTAAVKPTGIPPHVVQMQKSDTLVGICKETLSEVQALSGKVKEDVQQAINEAALNAGQVTVPRVLEIVSSLDDRITQLSQRVNVLPDNRSATEQSINATSISDPTHGIAVSAGNIFRILIARVV